MEILFFRGDGVGEVVGVFFGFRIGRRFDEGEFGVVYGSFHLQEMDSPRRKEVSLFSLRQKPQPVVKRAERIYHPPLESRYNRGNVPKDPSGRSR